MTTDSRDAGTTGDRPSDRLLAALAPYRRIVLVSHVNPDPDALASMLGLRALVACTHRESSVVMTVDGMIARAENRAMVELMPIPLEPVDRVRPDPETAFVMVDSQPWTGRRASESVTPTAVIDHHETGGNLSGVAVLAVRGHARAPSTPAAGAPFQHPRST